MAFNLRAILVLDDRFTDPMRRIERRLRDFDRSMDQSTRRTRLFRDENGRLRDRLGRFARESDRATDSVRRFGSGARGASGGVGKLIGVLGGLAGAYAAVNGAKKIFDATVLNAAKREQSSVIIGAMFDNKKLSAQYEKMLDEIAIKSPVLDSQAMYENSKGFISTTKNLNELKQMWSIAERLAAVDPMQGTEGAVFALKELLSGDAVSMVERFEMPRAVMNEIKNMDLPDALKAMDDFMNKHGMTQKLINEMGGTTLGVWQQVKEQMSLIFADMGKPALEPINEFLTSVLERLQNGELDGFKETGARWIRNIITGMTNTVMGIYDWFRGIAASDEWKEATTLSAKVEFIIDDLMARFNGWYESTGKAAIESATETIMSAIVSFVENNSDDIASAAWNVGSKMGSSMYKGFKAAVGDSWIGKALVGAGVGAAGGALVGGVGAIPGAVIGGGASLINSGYKWLTKDLEPDKSKAGGLDYVPYDGYKASLHKGETVLTRHEANQYRKGNSGGGSVTIGAIHLHGIGGDLEKAADQILGIMTQKIEAAGGAGA